MPTSATAAAGDYTADVGAATGAAKVALTISQATAAANTACTPADFPKTGNTCGAPAGSQKISLTTMAARAGTGSEETLSIFATLSDAANATKAPSTAGEVSVASANLYVVY